MAAVSAKCIGCGEPASMNPYEDEVLTVGFCEGCGHPICSACSVDLGDLCDPCREVIEAP